MLKVVSRMREVGSSIRSARVRDRKGVVPGLFGEIVLSWLPLLVIVTMMIHYAQPNEITASVEWSFAASVLFGQSIAKFVAGIPKLGEMREGAVALVVSGVVVFGLVPSLLTLFFILDAEHSHTPVSLVLRWAQMMMFLLSSVSYILIGAAVASSGAE